MIVAGDLGPADAVLLGAAVTESAGGSAAYEVYISTLFSGQPLTSKAMSWEYLHLLLLEQSAVSEFLPPVRHIRLDHGIAPESGPQEVGAEPVLLD